MNRIRTKRVYDAEEQDDGYRLLVDRLWPRGCKKETTHLDEWNREIAPSTALRKWFGHDVKKFGQFAQLYEEELKNKTSELERIYSISKTKNVTLLYAAKEKNINHAVVLLQILQKIQNESAN